MPCWVAPIVAAELWGVTPGHVLGAIADGSLPSKREYGFVVVDVAPDGACPAPRRGPPPPTFVLVADLPPDPEVPEVPSIVPAEVVPVAEDIVEEPVSDELPPLDEEEDDKPISNWRQVRSSVGRLRKPPIRLGPTAFAA
jgi:hypothetical protein